MKLDQAGKSLLVLCVYVEFGRILDQPGLLQKLRGLAPEALSLP